MSNPYSKLIPDPTKAPNPNTITLKDFEAFQSRDMQRSAANLRVFKRSFGYIGGCLGLAAVFCLLNRNAHKDYILGRTNKGGDYLDLKTVIDENHYAYNREFQRTAFLSETRVPDVSTISRQQLHDLGVKVPQQGAPNIIRRSPHEKFL